MQRLTILVLLIFFAALSPASAETVAGTVSKIFGTATAVGPSGSRSLALNDSVFVEDSLDTKTKTRLELAMSDGATLTLGAEATITIRDYTFEDNRGNASLNLARGAFRMVSGALKGGEDQGFELRTPVATIGIRGTDFWGGRLDGNYNFALLGGKGIYVENAAGRVEISEIGYGTTVTAADQPPSPPKKWSQAKVKRALDTVNPPGENNGPSTAPSGNSY